MNNNNKLSKPAGIVILGIVLALIAAYVPMLGLLGLVVAVPYAIIGTLADKKYYIMSVVVTFVVLMLSVSPMYAINICMLSAIPGLVIGNIAKNNMKNEDSNKFEPIYAGTIMFVISTIVFFFVAKYIFNVDLIEEFLTVMNESVKSQVELMQSINLSMGESIVPEDIVNSVRNMIPTALFFQGMVLALLTYCISAFTLKRMKKINFRLPKIKEFYLPGNAVVTSFMLYMLVLFIELIGLNLYTDLIMVNLQLVFNFMFMIQGIAICLYYISKMRREGPNKMMLFGGIMIFISGFMGISFVGMLDSIIDFRKVRSYKST